MHHTTNATKPPAETASKDLINLAAQQTESADIVLNCKKLIHFKRKLKKQVIYLSSYLKVMLQPSRQQILRLYKHLIRYGNQLQLTDKNYFLGRIRREFRDNRHNSDPLQIEFNFKRGETLLRKGRII